MQQSSKSACLSSLLNSFSRKRTRGVDGYPKTQSMHACILLFLSFVFFFDWPHSLCFQSLNNHMHPLSGNWIEPRRKLLGTCTPSSHMTACRGHQLTQHPPSFEWYRRGDFSWMGVIESEQGQGGACISRTEYVLSAM